MTPGVYFLAILGISKRCYARDRHDNVHTWGNYVKVYMICLVNPVIILNYSATTMVMTTLPDEKYSLPRFFLRYLPLAVASSCRRTFYYCHWRGFFFLWTSSSEKLKEKSELIPTTTVHERLNNKSMYVRESVYYRATMWLRYSVDYILFSWTTDAVELQSCV